MENQNNSSGLENDEGLETNGIEKIEKLPKGFTLAWATRGISLGLNTIILGFVSFYLTDRVGMAAGLVGSLLLASRIFSGVTDPIAGLIIDKTNTKLGKARPYELMVIPMWIATVLLFSVPDIGTVAQLLYVFVLYTLITGIFQTFLNGSEAVYLRRSVVDENNQSNVLSFSGLLIMVVLILVNILFPQLMDAWGTTKSGWTTISVVFAIPLTIIGLGRFFFVKEISDNSLSTEKYSLKESISALKQNKYIFIFSMVSFLLTTVNILSLTNTTYYFEYIVGDLGLMSIVSIAAVIAPFALLFFPFLAKKIGTTRLAKLGIILAILGNFFKLFAGSNILILLITTLISTVGGLPFSMLISLYTIECIDYGEWKTGKRIEGLPNSIVGFSNKIGNGVAVGLSGIIMGLAGYNGVLSQQSDTVNFVIVGLFSWIPALLSLAALFVLHFYDLDNKMVEIRKELKKRK